MNEKSLTPLAQQVGGNHYKGCAIQPVEYCHSNGIGFLEGCAIKYLTRWRSKGGIEDLKKAGHFIAMLIELEEKAANPMQTLQAPADGALSESRDKIIDNQEGKFPDVTLPAYIRLESQTLGGVRTYASSRSGATSGNLRNGEDLIAWLSKEERLWRDMVVSGIEEARAGIEEARRRPASERDARHQRSDSSWGAGSIGDERG